MQARHADSLLNDTAPRVAAVISNFRHGTFLGEAVRSVQSQTHSVDEIIVVDDASGPDEEEHLRRLEPSVRVLRSAENRGAGAARQLGTDASSCELVAYLDADDLWVPTKIERQLQHLRSNPDAVATHTGTVVFDGAGNEREYVNVKPLELVLHEQLRRNQVAPPTLLIRKDALSAVGGWCQDRGVVQDWDLFIRVAASGRRVVALREPLTRVRREGHNHLSRSGRRQVGRLLATLDRHAPLIEREFGRGALAKLRRQKILDHRHTYPRVQQPAAILGAWLAGLGLAPPIWKWLVATE